MTDLFLHSSYAPTVSALSTDADKGYAGGVVGSMLSTVTVDTTALGSGAFAIDGTITGGNAAGGYAGRYINLAKDATLDLSSYNITATVSGTYNGGVFGWLENQSAKYTITNGSTINSKTSGGTYGGIIGKYTTSALTDTLYLNDLTTNATANDTCDYFGGVIGYVDSATYIKAENVNVIATGTDKGWFGGLIGETSVEHGVFVDLNGFTLNANGYTGGGIVGTFHNGVLRLSGTTDMTNGKPADGANGQLIGINDNVLTYAVDTPADFAKTALNMQLNNNDSGYDCLLFDSASKRSTLLAATDLKLTNDISLSGTGITGFMRDGGDDVGTFTGTLDGANETDTYTITLATGEPYRDGVAVPEDYGYPAEGVGQIYRHKYNGLFSVLGGTVSNLTVAGVINNHSCVDGMNTGAIAAQNGGDVTLTGVTSSVTINDYGDVTGTEAAGRNISGFIGFVGTDGDITIDGLSEISTREPLKTMRKSAVYEKFAKRERQNLYKSGN